MISSLLSKLGLLGDDLAVGGEDSRKYIRHAGFRAEVEVGNRSYSLRDWSIGGLSFENKMDARMTAGDKINVVLKFRLPHDTVEVVEQATVIRTGVQDIAAQFTGLSPEARRQFARVVDSLHAQGFIESQVA